MKYLVPITISLVSLVGLAVTHPTGLQERSISSLQTQGHISIMKRGGEEEGNEQEGNEEEGNEEEGNEQEGNEEEGNEEEGNEEEGNEEEGNEEEGNEEEGNEEEGNEEEGNEQEGNEQEGNEQEGNEQEGNEQEGNEQEGNEQEGNEEEGNEEEGNDKEGNEEEGNEEEGNEEEGDNKEEGDTATGPFTGESTYYDATVGTGSCGEESGKDDAVVALSEELMENGGNSNENPLCGKKIKISVEGYDKVGTATVVDTCPGCPKNNVDINEEWARSMWGEKFMTDGVSKITWEFV